MKNKNLKLPILILIGLSLFSLRVCSQTFCDASANLFIYSNYDGGIIDINVDIDIPNIKIGLTSYEPMTINISGTYASNVTEIWYAGYNDDNNHNHCAIIPNTTITGASTAIKTIETYPLVTLNDPNGSSNMVCCAECSLMPSDCNTPNQIVDFFLQNMGGELSFHKTQYNCYTLVQNLSEGGNCCIGSSTVGLKNELIGSEVKIYPNPNFGLLNLSFDSFKLGKIQVRILDFIGRTVFEKELIHSNASTNLSLNISDFESGIYFIELQTDVGTINRKIIRQ